MEMPNPEARTQSAPQSPPSGVSKPAEPSGSVAKKKAPSPTRLPSIIVGAVVAAVAALSIWYLVRPQPLLVQGEVDATRLDIAARVDGRVAEIPVERGQDVVARRWRPKSWQKRSSLTSMSAPGRK
jgi:HlyD family secretion protein